jgi:hypothetical protein
MYLPVLVLHSVLRWAVLLLAVAATVAAIANAARSATPSAATQRLGLLFIIVLDMQLLVGLALFAHLSPITQTAFANMRSTMHTPALRFYTVEHTTAAVGAVLAAHVARIRARRAPDARKARALAVGFGIALVLILAAIPWPFRAIGRPLFRLSY